MASTKQRSNHPAQKRARTDARRQRVLRERRRRARRRRIYLSIGAIAALALIIVIAVAALPSKEARAHAPLELATVAPRATVQATAVPVTPTPAPELTPEPAAPVETAVPAATEAAVSDERLVVPLPTFDPSAPFSYENAYVAAVQGAITGPSVEAKGSKINSDKRARWSSASDGFMPMLSKANTKKKIIAVTVDDCFQADNLKKIVSLAVKYKSKLTIFPIGENLERASVAKVIKSAWKKGMEIENHTYSHKGTYHYDDDAMTDDIWRQSYLLNQALGVNYKQHFFRPKGGDERFDQRTHAYVSQLGFSAIALWTQSGSVDPVKDLVANLAPGRIYLFHTTDNDLKKLQKFIPAAVKRGYKLVTLNDMFGLPANETSKLSTAAKQKPAMQSFEVLPMTLKPTAYARAAAVVQHRLIALGWMKGDATGVYGKTTQASVALFQLAGGLSADGIAGDQVQRLLFSDAAPIGSDQRIRELAEQLGPEMRAAALEMLNA